MSTATDQQQQIPSPTPDQPPLIAGNYKDETAFNAGYDEIVKTLGLEGAAQTTFESLDQKVKAYKAMRTVLSQRKKTEEKPAETPVDDQKKTDQNTDLSKAVNDDPDLNAVLTTAGLKAEDLAESWKTGKKLTDEQYAALKKVNPLFGRKLVDQYFSGVEAQAQTVVHRQTEAKSKAVQIAGGEDELRTILEFAKGLPNAAELSKGLEGFDTYETTLKAIMHEHQKTVGSTKVKTLINDGAAAATTGGFASVEDYMATVKAAKAGGGYSASDLAKIRINGDEMARRASMGRR